MDRMRCSHCGEEHDLSELEPSYDRPDAYFEVPAEERDARTHFGSDDGRIHDADRRGRRHFVRALLPIPVRGEPTACSWGVWVEVSGPAWERTRRLWHDPVQRDEPPFAGQLANALVGYDGTLGLPGRLQLTGPTTAPRFVLDETVTHPLARDQREGVFPERVLEWLSAVWH
ncbi:MAG TPA: DUF2199 domain-containing protein [Gemmatimonadaceae bacterium]|nr:DUF2199 domain-containing protein [Gemmatimonadaceae bacterium]